MMTPSPNHDGNTLLCVIDPLQSLNPKKDSTLAMIEAAQRAGWQCAVCQLNQLSWVDGVVSAAVQWVHIDVNNTEAWFKVLLAETIALNAVGVVLMRKDPPVDDAYIHATWMLSMAEQQGARVWNQPQALRDHNEKLAIAEFLEFTAPTCVSCDMGVLKAFITKYPEAVAKPLNGMGGASVFRIRPNDANISVILETLTNHGMRLAMVQRYLPAIEEGDKRILLINGKPIPYVLARKPKLGEHRGNLAAGGTGLAQPLSDSDRMIAETLGPILRQRGLFLVGLDVIGHCLTEVNVTSPTCFREITAQTGFDVAAHFIQELGKAGRHDGALEPNHGD